MKKFSDFLDSIDMDEIKAGVSISLEGVPLTEKQKESIGAMCYGMIADMLNSYHEWLLANED